jgi:hypothetical protein
VAGRDGDFRAARIGAATGLVIVIMVLLLLDAVRNDYEVDAIVVGTILTTVVTLLGIEAGAVGLARIRGKSVSLSEEELRGE